MKNGDVEYLRKSSRLFSRSHLNKMMVGNLKPLIDIANEKPELYSGHNTYLEVLESIYSELKEQYPSEYIVKNELLKSKLTNLMTPNPLKVFNELRIGGVGGSIADLASFSRCSVAYEIKTKLDSDTRLSEQIENYDKIFDKTYLVIDKTDIDKYEKYSCRVGIITYDLPSNDFRVLVESKYSTRLDKELLMSMFHTQEYVDICNSYYEEVPVMNGCNKYTTCKPLILNVPDLELNQYYKNAMIKRKIHNIFEQGSSSILNQASLALNLTSKKYAILLNHLSQTF